MSVFTATINNLTNLTANFIANVSRADEFDTVTMPTSSLLSHQTLLQKGVEGGFIGVSANVKDGDGPIGLYIGPNFTDSLVER